MPDIEPRIADWRRALAETAGCTDEVLDELESHLRDEVQRLVQTGEPEERALDLALSRLGPPQGSAVSPPRKCGAVQFTQDYSYVLTKYR